MRIDENVKACIFDMDGTIIDSMGVWYEIDLEFAARYNIKLTTEYKREIQGLTFYDTAVYYKKRFNMDLSIEEILKAWNDMAYEKYTKHIGFKEGVEEFLKRLRNKGIKTAIVTSNSRKLTYGFLQANDALKYFDFVCTSDDIKSSKPAPDGYLYAAENLKVEPSNCLVFEDVPNGILAGINAGMKTCGIYDHYSKEFDEEKRKLADHYIENYGCIEL